MAALSEKGLVLFEDFTNSRNRKVAADFFMQVQQMEGACTAPLNLGRTIIPVLIKVVLLEMYEKWKRWGRFSAYS